MRKYFCDKCGSGDDVDGIVVGAIRCGSGDAIQEVDLCKACRFQLRTAMLDVLGNDYARTLLHCHEREELFKL